MKTTEPWATGPDIDGIPGEIGHVVFWPGDTSPRRPWWIVEWQQDNGGVFVIVNADGVIGTATPNELTRDFRKYTGPRQVGVWKGDDLMVCMIQPNGERHSTHRPDSDETTILANATAMQMERFERAAKAAGHPSGRSAANELNLWDSTVAEAIKVAGCTTMEDE